jgi:hypothetical protein
MIRENGDGDTEPYVKYKMKVTKGPVAGLVGIEGGVVSGVINLESLGVRLD